MSMPSSLSFDLRNRQMLVYRDPARFRLVVAGRRFGKTHLALCEMLRAAVGVGRRVWYVGPSYPQAKSIAWRRLKSLTRPFWEGRASEKELTVFLASGSTISLRGADRPDSLRGNSLDFVVLDEFASMRPSVWTEALRPALSDRQGRALFLGTPQGCNHFFELYDQAQTASAWAAFKFTTAQGGNVSPIELTSAAAELDSDSYSQEFEAAFTGAGRHRVYYSFDRSIHLASVEFQPNSPLVWSIDFNVDPMCMLLMQRFDETVYVLDEIVLKPDANTEAACEAFHQRVKSFASKRVIHVEVYGDSSGYQRRTSASDTDWTLIRQILLSLGWRLSGFHPDCSLQPSRS